jgi:hypothetical protein
MGDPYEPRGGQARGDREERRGRDGEERSEEEEEEEERGRMAKRRAGTRDRVAAGVRSCFGPLSVDLATLQA